MAENKDETVKMGLALWLSLCLLVCLWFIRGFTKGRQQFQNNLHVIEDGLRRMQENLEMEQRKKSMGYVESMEEITGFLDGLAKCGTEDNKSRQTASEDDNKTQNQELPSEEENHEAVEKPNSGESKEEVISSEDKKTV